MREGGSATRQLILALLSALGCAERDLRVSMELGSVEGVQAAVEAGYGVSIVSRVAVQHSLRLGCIKTVGVQGLTVERQISIARNRLRSNTAAQQRFRDFIDSPEGQALIAGFMAS